MTLIVVVLLTVAGRVMQLGRNGAPRYVAPVRWPDFSKRPRNATFCKAAENGDLPTVRHLLDHGVSPDAAIDYGNYEGASALQLAAAGGYVEVVQLLLDRGADINGPNPWGATALTKGAFEGKPEVVRLLILRGADVNADDDGTLPLDYVIHQEHETEGQQRRAYFETVRLLQDAGAKRSFWIW